MKFPCQLPACPAYIFYLTDITTYIPISLRPPGPGKTPKQPPTLNETFNQVNETLKERPNGRLKAPLPRMGGRGIYTIPSPGGREHKGGVIFALVTIMCWDKGIRKQFFSIPLKCYCRTLAGTGFSSDSR